MVSFWVYRIRGPYHGTTESTLDLGVVYLGLGGFRGLLPMTSSSSSSTKLRDVAAATTRPGLWQKALLTNDVL